MGRNDYYVTPIQKDLFIIGLNLKTDYGIIRPIKVKEYASMAMDLQMIKSEDWEIKSLVKKFAKDTPIKDKVYDKIDNNSLIECIQENVYGLRDRYNNIFKKIVIDFDEKKFLYQFSSQQEFDDFRKLILKFNQIPYIEWNPNPELRYFQRLELFFKKNNSKSIDFNAMYSSLMYVGHSPHNINDYTLSQFYSLFKRIELFKGYDTSTLYKTVDSSGKTEIVEWYQSTDDVGEEKRKDWEQIKQENKKFTKE